MTAEQLEHADFLRTQQEEEQAILEIETEARRKEIVVNQLMPGEIDIFEGLVEPEPPIIRQDLPEEDEEDYLKFIEVSNYNEQGELDGVQETWYKGELMESWTYRQGVKHGPAYMVFPDVDKSPSGWKDQHCYYTMRNGIQYGRSILLGYDKRVINKTYHLNLR